MTAGTVGTVSENAGDGPIVIAASMGFVVKNYLLGSCAASLRRAGYRVVALSPLANDASFRGAMLARGIEVEPLDVTPPDAAWTRMRQRRTRFHWSWLDNETVALKRSIEKPMNQRLSRLGWFRQGVANWVEKKVARPETLNLLDKWERRHALRSPQADYYRQLFSKLRPRLVFCPAPQMAEEWLPHQVAREMGIPDVLGVLSWDNLSSKDRMPVPASDVLVWGDHMRREYLSAYPQTPPGKVSIVGAPQFDYYFDARFQESREAFLPKLGLDPGRPMIVYAGVTPGLMPDEPKIVETFIESMHALPLPGNPQLHVRLHPKDGGERYQHLQGRWPDVTFAIPGARSRGEVRQWQPDDDDLRLLVNTVRHGDVQINVASTMTIDASVMNRPVVNVQYDFRAPGTPRSWGLCIYDTTHYLPIVRTKGARVARTPEELAAAVKMYLQDPKRDQQERRQIVDTICGTVDGHAGQRVAAKLDEICRLPVY